jgi:hypothetical protein
MKARRRLGGEIVPYQADAVAWLDALTLVEAGLVNGDPVTAWTSRFNPLTASAAQVGVGAIPALVANVDATGKPGVSFNGSSHFMTLGDAWKLSPTANWTKYIVVRRSSTGTSAMMGWNTGTTAVGYNYNFVITGGNTHNWTIGGTFSGNISSPTYPNGTRRVVTVTNPSASGYSVHFNAAEAYTVGSNGSTTSTAQPLLGARWATGNTAQELFLNGTIQGVLAYNAAHDATQRAAVLDFLYARYGVTP